MGLRQQMTDAETLSALYNHALGGMGMAALHYIPNHIMSAAEAEKFLEHQSYFDYVFGRALKVDFGRNRGDYRLYERDNGNALEALTCPGCKRCKPTQQEAGA